MHFKLCFFSIVLLFALSISVSLRAQHSLKVREGYLQGADDVRLYYRVVGSASDTIVAVHGGPGAGMNAFLPDIEPLAQNHTVIFYDQRNTKALRRPGHDRG